MKPMPVLITPMLLNAIKARLVVKCKVEANLCQFGYHFRASTIHGRQGEMNYLIEDKVVNGLRSGEELVEMVATVINEDFGR